MKKIIKYIICGAGVTFMFTTLVLWIGATFLAGKDGINDISFRSETFAAIFVFSLLTALISLVLKAKFIQAMLLRVSLHFVLSIGSFVLFVYMAGVTSRGSGVLTLTATVGLIYITVAAITLAVRSSSAKKAKEKQKYESLYDK